MKVFFQTALYTVFSAVIISASSCGDKNSGDSHAESNHEGHTDNEIIIDAARFGIQTQTVVPAEFNESIQLSGQIENAASGESTVAANTSGIITLQPGINVGSHVSRGTVIARIKSDGLSGGNPNAAALAALNAAKKELDRLEPLLAEGIVTKREYNAALAAYQSAKAAYSPVAASGVITAPMDGVVVELPAQSGSVVGTGSQIARISRSGSLQLRADLPEKYRSRIGDIKGVYFRVSSSDEWIDIDSVGGRVNIGAASGIPANGGYIPVYFTIDNNGSLSSGIYADVCLLFRGGEMAVSVPRKAIIEQQGNYFVYVKTGDHSYMKRKIAKGESNGSRVRILSGIDNGDVVVTKGATLVRLAETSGAVPEGHTHNH